MVKPYLNQVGGNVDNDVAIFSGGLNAYEDKAFLEANQLPYVMNMCMRTPPRLETRTARITWARSFESMSDVNNKTVVSIYVNNLSDIFLIVKEGTTTTLERYYRNQNGLFVRQVVDTIPTYDRYYFTYCPIGVYKYLYIGNEYCKMRVDLAGAPGNLLVLTVYSDGYYGIPVWHKSKLWLAQPSKNIILWSNSLQPDDFTVGQAGFAGELYVTKRIGNIVNIISFDDKLMVFCEHSIHAIYGDSGDPSNANFFQLVDIANNLGLLTPDCLTIGAERLYWLGDNKEVYEYTGASLRMISRPGKSRNDTISVGGVSGLLNPRDVIFGIRNNSISKFVATSEKLYINIWNRKNPTAQKLLFVFDIYNRTWWCEDGDFTTIANYSDYDNRIILAKPNGDLLINEENPSEGTADMDYVFDFETSKVVEQPISYEFHTRVYGADGTDLRKSISKVWFQASADAEVFLNNVWTSKDMWSVPQQVTNNLVKIGDLEQKEQLSDQATRYRPNSYEQQVCYLQKMYGERLNTFQIVVKGQNGSKFYLMKRVWRAE